MDFQSMGFIALMTIGAVNIVGFFAPSLDSKIKIAISFMVAFGLTFVPVDIANIILEKVKIALEVTLGSSGIYKLSQNIKSN